MDVARAVAAVILAMLVVLPIAVVYAAKPGWVAEGKYAEYDVYVESSALNVSGRIGSARIEFKSVGDINATVEISASVDQRVVDSLRNMLSGSASLPIPVPETASYVYTWRYEDDLPPFLLGFRSLENLSRGQIPFPPQGVLLSVSLESKSVPAGRFDCYKLSASILLLGASLTINAWYEKSTGLLIAYEYDVQLLGQRIHISVQLKSTNILGGPGILLTAVIVIVVVVAAAAIGATIMLRRSRKTAAVQQQIQPSTSQAQPQ